MKENKQIERVNSDEEYKDCYGGDGDARTSSLTSTITGAGAGGGMMMLEQLENDFEKIDQLMQQYHIVREDGHF